MKAPQAPVGSVRAVPAELAHPQYTLKEQVAKLAKSIKPRRYFSQPMPKSYSKPFAMAHDHAIPSVMQEAFARSIP